jgi:hypothetical protein
VTVLVVGVTCNYGTGWTKTTPPRLASCRMFRLLLWCWHRRIARQTCLVGTSSAMPHGLRQSCQHSTLAGPAASATAPAAPAAASRWSSGHREGHEIGPGPGAPASPIASQRSGLSPRAAPERGWARRSAYSTRSGRGLVTFSSDRFAVSSASRRSSFALVRYLAELAVALLARISCPGMSTRPPSPPGDPMTLGNMHANGVRSLAVSCWQCHHEAVLSADRRRGTGWEECEVSRA